MRTVQVLNAKTGEILGEYDTPAKIRAYRADPNAEIAKLAKVKREVRSVVKVTGHVLKTAKQATLDQLVADVEAGTTRAERSAAGIALDAFQKSLVRADYDEVTETVQVTDDPVVTNGDPIMIKTIDHTEPLK